MNFQRTLAKTLSLASVLLLGLFVRSFGDILTDTPTDDPKAATVKFQVKLDFGEDYAKKILGGGKIIVSAGRELARLNLKEAKPNTTDATGKVTLILTATDPIPKGETTFKLIVDAPALWDGQTTVTDDKGNFQTTGGTVHPFKSAKTEKTEMVTGENQTIDFKTIKMVPGL